MKAKVRKILLILALAALLCGTGILLSLSGAQKASGTCEGLRVEYADKYRFVSEEDVKQYLDKYYPGYIGKKLDSLNLSKIEEILDDRSAVLKSEAFVTSDNMLNVRLSQRKPVLRFQNGDTGFYVDARGYIFPLDDKCHIKVPVIDGALPLHCPEGFKGRAQTEKEALWIEKVIALMDWIADSRVWKEAIVQAAVADGGDLILVPRIGKERFIFGSPDDVEEKFSKIETYYEYIRPAVGDSLYSSVNVKYDKQIICRK